MIQKSIEILRSLQQPSGLFIASSPTVRTGYNRAWIRDTIYESMGLEAVKSFKELIKSYHALLDILLKHEYKINWAIKEKPKYAYQYIHARYDPSSGNEIMEEWGNKQNDAIGALLFKVGDLEYKGIKILRDNNDVRILQKLVYYLKSIEYWHDKDNGMWEESEEVHASSVGACVAGLKAVKSLVNVPSELIKKGEEALNRLLPHESESKKSDLALLSLIYPYNVVNPYQRQKILEMVESDLVKEKGVIRYKGDKYYSNGKEAQWTFGFPWLAIIYRQLNRPDKYAYYMRKTLEVMNNKGELPELYYANSDIHNENSPLGWSQALFLVMCSA
jgi:GH15 family glucan-1,4-alpha-glucosidase